MDRETEGQTHDEANIRFLQLTNAHKSHSLPLLEVEAQLHDYPRCILLELLLWLIVPDLYVGSTLRNLSFYTKPT